MKFTLCLALAATVFLTALPASAQTASFSDQQKQDIETIIYNYLMDNPDVIFEAADRQRQKAELQRAAKFTENLQKYQSKVFDDDAPFAGNPKGDVVVVEFFDYNCGYCRKALDDVLKLVAQDKNVKVIFKDLPILSAQSVAASQWAIAAAKQGKYFEFHKKAMKLSGQKSEAALSKIAKEVGMDIDQAKKDAASDETKAEIAQNLALSRELGIGGTPAFIIGDQLTPGYMGYDNLKKAVDDVRAAAQ